MECTILDSSNSPPQPPEKGAASAGNSSVESTSERFMGTSALVSSSNKIIDSSDSDSLSSSSSSSSSSNFVSKCFSAGCSDMHSSAPKCVPVSESADAPSRKREPKVSYRTIRYFDEADASITCFNCGGCGHMSRECVQVAKPRPCNICGATDHSVHACPNTPCFRCRLPGHRAKDCGNRRWPKDMCWRCFRTDSHSPWECSRAQVLSLNASSNVISCPNCGRSGHSAFHCPEAPFNEQLLRPGADVSSVVPIDPWKGAKEKKMKSGTISHYACLVCANSKATGSRLSSSSSAAVPLLKDPKKIAKMLKKMQKAKRAKRQQEKAGADSQALQRIQKKIDRFSAMDSLAEKDTRKLVKAGIGKKKRHHQ